MRFLGSEQSLHISSHPETACATLDMLFPLVWVCYLFISSFIHFLHSIVFESSHTSSRQFFLSVEVTEVFDEEQIKQKWVTVLPSAVSQTQTHALNLPEARPCPILLSNRE